MNKPSIFKDSETQNKFDRDGYVLIDLITGEEAEFIGKKFYEVYSDLPPGFFSAAFNPNEEIKEDIFKHTDLVFDKALNDVFHNFDKLGATFLSKAPGKEGKVGVHQDWYVVDETCSYSATIWVPMRDTDETNGTLMVLPGSHLFFDTFRSNHIPLRYREHIELLWENMITVPVKAGQAFVLNHAVIHASAPNISDKERLVMAYGVTPKGSSLVYYHQNDEGKVEKYNMPKDFFQRYFNIGQRPLIGELVQTFNYPVPAATLEEMHYLIAQAKKISNSYSLASLNAEKLFDDRGYIMLPPSLPKIWPLEANKSTIKETASHTNSYTPLNLLRELKHKIFG